MSFSNNRLFLNLQLELHTMLILFRKRDYNSKKFEDLDHIRSGHMHLTRSWRTQTAVICIGDR